MILVIDGQGGGIGRSLVEMLKEAFPNEEIGAVGANAIATANMVKGSPSFAVTGENGVIYNCSQADVIVGPIGIALANAMHGEITPAMASAVFCCAFTRHLPFVCLAGIQDLPLGNLALWQENDI